MLFSGCYHIMCGDACHLQTSWGAVTLACHSNVSTCQARIPTTAALALQNGRCSHRPRGQLSDNVVYAQLLAVPSADEADEEEASASGRLRVAGRRDAWEELQLRKTAQLAAQMRDVEAQVAELESEVRNPRSGSAAEDGCLLEQLQLRALQQQSQPAPMLTV